MKQREIDLRDMIVDILFHWKGLLVIMIVGAVLMGGLSYVRSYRNGSGNSGKDTCRDRRYYE